MQTYLHRALYQTAFLASLDQVLVHSRFRPRDAFLSSHLHGNRAMKREETSEHFHGPTFIIAYRVEE